MTFPETIVGGEFRFAVEAVLGEPDGLAQPARIVALDVEANVAWGLCMIHDTIISQQSGRGDLAIDPKGPDAGGPISWRFNGVDTRWPSLMWWVGPCPVQP